jgi:hypothetical protein
LVRLAADLDDADDVAVFVAEELHDVGAALDVGVFDFAPGNGVVGFDGGVDLFLHRGDLLGGDGGAVEVEAQAVFIDERTLLRGVCGDDLVQRPMEKVGGGVVGFDRAAAGGGELERDLSAGLD